MLEVRQLSKVFFEQNDPRKPGFVALYKISLAIRKNEFVSLLGPSGCGKTTLIRIIAGMIPADRGDVMVNGQKVTAPGGDRCMVFQQFGLLPWRTVVSNVEFGLEIEGVPKDERRQAAEKYLDLVGLKGFEHYYPHQISGGMQQRVGIAQAIIHSPSVVILDEPTVGLDPIQIREIRALITDLGREHSVILSTHILPEVQTLCSRVQIIHKGRLVFSDSLEGLSAHMQPTSLLLTLRHPPDNATLKRVAGVENVEELDPNRRRLDFDPHHNPAEAIAVEAAQQGWGLQELVQERKTLEQIFVSLTTGDESTRKAITSDTTEAAA